MQNAGLFVLNEIEDIKVFQRSMRKEVVHRIVLVGEERKGHGKLGQQEKRHMPRLGQHLPGRADAPRQFLRRHARRSTRDQARTFKLCAPANHAIGWIHHWRHQQLTCLPSFSPPMRTQKSVAGTPIHRSQHARRSLPYVLVFEWLPRLKTSGGFSHEKLLFDWKAESSVPAL